MGSALTERGPQEEGEGKAEKNREADGTGPDDKHYVGDICVLRLLSLGMQLFVTLNICINIYNFIYRCTYSWLYKGIQACE